MTGIEPVTSSLPRKRSTPELHRQGMSGRRNSNPRPLAWKANALPTELLPLVRRSSVCRLAGLAKVYKYFSLCLGCSTSQMLRRTKWGEEDSNLRSHKTADLQSAPVGHFGISPTFFFKHEPMGGLEPSTC